MGSKTDLVIVGLTEADIESALGRGFPVDAGGAFASDELKGMPTVPGSLRGLMMLRYSALVCRSAGIIGADGKVDSSQFYRAIGDGSIQAAKYRINKAPVVAGTRMTWAEYFESTDRIAGLWPALLAGHLAHHLPKDGKVQIRSSKVLRRDFQQSGPTWKEKLSGSFSASDPSDAGNVSTIGGQRALSKRPRGRADTKTNRLLLGSANLRYLRLDTLTTGQLEIEGDAESTLPESVRGFMMLRYSLLVCREAALTGTGGAVDRSDFYRAIQSGRVKAAKSLVNQQLITSGGRMRWDEYLPSDSRIAGLWPALVAGDLANHIPADGAVRIQSSKLLRFDFQQSGPAWKEKLSGARKPAEARIVPVGAQTPPSPAQASSPTKTDVADDAGVRIRRRD